MINFWKFTDDCDGEMFKSGQKSIKVRVKIQWQLLSGHNVLVKVQCQRRVIDFAVTFLYT